MRRMRRSMIVAAALAGSALVALVGIASAAPVSNTGTTSGGTLNQSIRATVDPNKAVKKAQKGIPATFAKLTVGVNITQDQGNRPAASRQVDIQIGEKDEFFFDLTGLGKCSRNQLENASTADADQACKKAKVGQGTSEAMCSASPSGPGARFPGVVRAYNGGSKGKNKTLWLHAYTNFPTGPVATVLEGTLDKNNNLSVPVEVLGEGSCGITDFESTINKTTKVKGEKHSYVSVACPDKSWEFEGRFQYYDNPYGVNELSPSTSLACKGK